MAFKDFLLSFFPHRWLNPNHPNNLKFFEGLSNSLDYVNGLIDSVSLESNIVTATDLIVLYEKEYNITTDTALPIEIRRANILAQKRKLNNPITKQDLISILETAGLTVDITNIRDQYRMNIKILSPHGTPSNFEQVKDLVEKITRAHIEKVYEFTYSTNAELSNYTHAQLKTKTHTEIREVI